MTAIYTYPPYEHDSDQRRGTEERHGRAARAGSARAGAEARLRDRTAHRGALGGCGVVQRRFALSRALSAGASRLDLRALGRESRAAPPSLLPTDSERSQVACGPARELGRVHDGRAARGRDRLCVTSRLTSALG